MKRKYKLCLFFIFCLISTLIFGETQPTFNLAVNLLPKTMNPTKVWNYQHFFVIQNILDTIVTINENNEISSNIAKRWSISKNGKTYIFLLDQEKYFSDGKNVTSDEVAKSISNHFIKKSTSVVKGYLQNVIDTKEKNGILKCIQIINKFKLTITLKHPYSPFLKVLSMPAFSIFKIQGKKIIGSGSYALKSRNKNEIFLEKNKYSKKEMYYQKLKISEINPLKLNREYLKNDLVLGFTPDDIESLNISDEYKVDYLKSFVFFHFYYNTKRYPFNSFEFRQMFSHEFNNFLKTYKSSSKILKINRFIPKGILPPVYYKLKKNNEHTKKYLKEFCQKKNCPSIYITIRKEYLKDTFSRALINYFSSFKIKIVITIIKKEDFIKSLQNKKYDLISAGYYASFTDPDAFINLINNQSSFHYTDFNTQKFIKRINKANSFRNKIKRLNLYIDELKALERNNILIPGYQYLMPILYKKQLQIPNWDYRTEGDIWKITKKNK